ncbi:MAG: hypothetical protein V8R52_10085 [Coprobacter fastidiosus]
MLYSTDNANLDISVKGAINKLEARRKYRIIKRDRGDLCHQRSIPLELKQQANTNMVTFVSF